MSIYKIKHSIDRKVVGEPAQIQEFSRKHVMTGQPYYSQNNEGRFDDDIVWPVYEMERNALLTDLIHNVPLGASNLMIGPRCFELLANLKLPEFQMFPLKFTYCGELIDEYVAFSIVKKPHFVDFISWKHSRFYKTENWHKDRLQTLTFDSLDELMAYKKRVEEQGYGVWPEIKITYHNEYDIINFGRYPMPSGFLCSLNAKNRILEAKLTGFDFEELPASLFIHAD